MRENNKQRPLLRAEADGIIEGRNAVIEALRSGENIDKIYLAKGERTRPWATLPPAPGRRASWWWRPTGASWTA